MDENSIPTVIDRIGCSKHNADRGRPCWQIWTIRGPKLPAICNRRALRAGFVGEIDPRSLRQAPRKDKA